MDNKIVGGTVATTFPVPTKISQLVDDTTKDFQVKWAGECYEAKNADRADTAATSEADSDGNIFQNTYATKEEVGNINNAIDLIEAIQNQLIGGASE